jgi:hypothetical protein
MSNRDFFEEAFGDPADDPLLQGEEPESDESGQAFEPSWMSEGEERGSGDSEVENHEGDSSSQKTVAVEVGAKRGLEEINRSLEGEWRLMHIALDEEDYSPEGHSSETGRSRKVLMTLRREGAGSLFDFG